MKHFIHISIHTFLVCIVILICLALPTLADTGTINSSVVNIRSGPGTNFPVAGSAYQGTEVSILNSINGWYEVQLGNLTGWLSTSLLDVAKQDIFITVKSELVNLRSGPGTNFENLGQVVQGDALILLEVQNDWCKVKTADGKTGYVAAYLMNNPAELQDTTPGNQSPGTTAIGESLVQNGGEPQAPLVFLNNRQLTFDVPPLIENDRTLVPLRAIFESMGATVNWDNDSRTVRKKAAPPWCLP